MDPCPHQKDLAHSSPEEFTLVCVDMLTQATLVHFKELPRLKDLPGMAEMNFAQVWGAGAILGSDL